MNSVLICILYLHIMRIILINISSTIKVYQNHVENHIKTNEAENN